MDWTSMTSTGIHYRWAVTAVLLLGVLLARWLAGRAVGRLRRLAQSDRLRWHVRIRGAAFLVLLAGLIWAWSEQLQAFALSILAFAVALAIAGKELILCVSGALIRAISKPFQIGDRIEVKGVRGYVINHSLLTTTLLEIGPGKTGQMQTGYAITMPNRMLLDGAVINESFLEEYVLHTFNVPMKLGADWRGAQRRLLEIATEECGPFTEATGRYVEKLRKTHGLNLPTAEPRVNVHLVDPEKINLVVRVPAPARRRGRIEQAILGRFLDEHAQFTKRAISDESPQHAETSAA